MSEDERTPLINSGTRQPSSSWLPGINHTNKQCRTLKVYGFILAFLLLVGTYSTWLQSRMPSPLGDAQAAHTDGFAGIHAYNEYLTRFYAPHPSNSRENARIKNWLVSLCEDFQAKANEHGATMDLVANDDTKTTLSQDWFSKGKGKWGEK